MSDEQDKLKLSLEPPKLFGRKKKSDAMGTSKHTSPAPAARRRPAADEPVPAEEVAEEPVVEEDVDDTTLVEVPEETAAEEASAETEPETEHEPVAEATPEPVTEPAPEPVATPDPEPETPAVAPQKAAAPAKKATPAKKPAAPTAPAAKAAVPVAKPADKPAAKSGTAASTAVAKSAQPAKKSMRPRAKLAPDIEPEPMTSIDREDAEIVGHDAVPLLPLYPAAAVTGAVVGLAMVLLTWLSLRGCDAIRGTASCGGGPGFVLLVATFVLCILLGSTLLKVFSIPDPGSSSFLAVGLVAVVALLFLIDALDHWSMLIVIPLISIGGFLTSVWVTKTFVEPGDTEL